MMFENLQLLGFFKKKSINSVKKYCLKSPYCTQFILLFRKDNKIISLFLDFCQ